MALTRRQKQVLDFLVGFINRKGYSPSFEEIGSSLDLSSLATVHRHLETLEKKGFIRRGYNQSRSVEVVALPGPVPFPKTAIQPIGRSRRAAAPRPGATVAAAAATRGETEFPLLGRIAGEVILREIRPIVRQELIRADQDDRSLVTSAT